MSLDLVQSAEITIAVPEEMTEETIEEMTEETALSAPTEHLKTTRLKRINHQNARKLFRAFFLQYFVTFLRFTRINRVRYKVHT